MKRLTALLLALMILLCGCDTPEPATEPPATESQMLPIRPETEPTSDNTEAEGLLREPETASPAPGQHQAAFSLLENDHSIRSTQGDILVMIRYDQIILDTGRPEWAAINDRIAGDYLAFLEEMAYLQETPAAQWEQMLQDMGALYGNFLSTCIPEVTCNSGDIFSIRMTREWYMGGVYNRDSYGLNFDLATGEELTLARLSDLPEEEFAEQLKTIVCGELAEDYDALTEDPAAVLQDWTLADFSFFLEEGELVLTFPTYTFGPGAMGSTAVRTGLYPRLG